jgi:hypothetical protein
MWTTIQNDIISMFKLLENIAKSSYQIDLIVSSDVVKTLCDRFRDTSSA